MTLATNIRATDMMSNPRHSDQHNELAELMFGAYRSVTQYFEEYGGNVAGTEDCSAAVMAAIADLGARGGTIFFPAIDESIYLLEDTVTVTENKRIKFLGHGALINFTGITAFHIETGSNVANRGQVIEGLRFNGNSDVDSLAISIADTNWFTIREVVIENCGRAILCHAKEADEFVEGLRIDGVVIRNPVLYGIEYRRTNGTSSMGQHCYTNLAMSGLGTGHTGLVLPSDCSIYRCFMEMLILVGEGGTAYSVDGDVGGARLLWSTEFDTGADNCTGVLIGANAQGLDQSLNIWDFQDGGSLGTGSNHIVNASSINYYYQQGRRFFGTATTSPIQVFREGLAGSFLSFGTSGAGGALIVFGNGSVADVNLYRSAANTLKTDDSLHIGANLAHLGSNVGFYNTSPIAKQTGVAVTAEAIHAALVALGLISA